MKSHSQSLTLRKQFGMLYFPLRRGVWTLRNSCIVYLEIYPGIRSWPPNEMSAIGLIWVIDIVHPIKILLTIYWLDRCISVARPRSSVQVIGQELRLNDPEHSRQSLTVQVVDHANDSSQASESYARRRLILANDPMGLGEGTSLYSLVNVFLPLLRPWHRTYH